MNKYSEVADRVLKSYVITPEIIRVWDELDFVRPHNKDSCKQDPPGHLFISGKSRSGKSKMVQKYAEKNSGHIINNDGIEIDLKPVVYMELPYPFTQLGFYKKIADALGAPRLPGRQSIDDAQDRAFMLIEKMRVEMLILDEIDYIAESRAVSAFEAMETLKYISNKGKVSLVCVGQPECDELRKMNLQYFSRFTPIYFERFNECNAEFCFFLKKLEEHIKVPKYIGIGEIETGLPQMLYNMSMGLVGLLSRIIYVTFRTLGKLNECNNDYLDDELFIDILLKAQESVIGNINPEDFGNIINGQLPLNKYRNKKG